MSTPSPEWLSEQRALLSGHALSALEPSGGFGWLDANGALVRETPVQTWITTRMTYVLALASLRDGLDTSAAVAHGVAALQGTLRGKGGGWSSEASREGKASPERRAYEHAFVLLSACAAAAAGSPGASDMADKAMSYLETHFWDADRGWYADVVSPALDTREPYFGANSSMHLVEALIAAHDANVADWALERALAIADTVIHLHARGHDYRLPEHYDEYAQPLLDYNRDAPRHRFRPYGVTIGHQLEWARLLVQLGRALGAAAPAWLLEDAEALFAMAVADGWQVDGAPGFVYTVDFDGEPVVRERLHWVLAEALNAAYALGVVTGKPAYDEWQRVWWEHARDHFIDTDGSWIHELSPTLSPSDRVWSGRPDIYHAYQALLMPAVGLTSSFVRP